MTVADKSVIHTQSIQKLYRFLLLVFNIKLLLDIPVAEHLFCNYRCSDESICVALIYGGLAQLVEHLPCKQGVSGSIPLTSTKTFDASQRSIIYNGLIAQLVRAHA